MVERSIDAYASLRAQLGGAAILTPAVVGSFVFVTLLAAGARRDRTALVETRDQLDQAIGLISKYVPAELASGILSGTEGASSGYRRQKVTSFFSDIVGFTELAEEMEPEELAVVLNEYFTEMAAIADRHHGTVDELQGDGLILVFGAPNFRSDREHALDAVRAASEMQTAIGELNERWRAAGVDVNIRVRMGINTGVVTVGHFGTGNRLKYTVLGKHVNLASRVQAMCEPGKVLISNSTWLLVKHDVATRSLGERDFKGITRPVEVHELA
jgi:class 3 adenylate cyclase